MDFNLNKPSMAFLRQEKSIRTLVKTDEIQNKIEEFDYLSAVKALVGTTYKNLYIIDFEKKEFEYVSNNPIFLCGHNSNEVQSMGFSFYQKCVSKEDLKLFCEMNQLGLEFYKDVSLENRKNYTMSYDFHLIDQKRNKLLINQKITPITSNDQGFVCKAICVASISSEKDSGNLKISNNETNEIFKYDFEFNGWVEEEKIEITDREKDIIHYSTRGYSIDKIASAIFISPHTVKFHRKRLFEKLKVENISHAIAYATSNRLI